MSHQDFCDRFMALLQKGDFDALGPMLDPDFVLREARGLPYAGEYHGLDGWRALSRAVSAAWAGMRLERLEYVAEGADTLVVRFALSGKSRKNGTPFETTVMELWRFRDGKLREILPYYWDTHHLATIHRGA